MDGFNEEDVINEPVTGFPVTFIKGGDSDYIGKDDEVRIRRFFPAAEITSIPGTSHWLHAEKPEELIRLIREYFEVS
jgi:esterase